jgi:SAM-dependent methyltransferase
MLEDLRCIAASTGERRGWDFSRVRTARDPVPWDYADVVRRYLEPASHVLDVGTGGGEVFLSLAPYFGSGVGIDSDLTMIQVAQENLPPSLADKVSFQVLRAEDLQFPDESFDVVLNRHCSVFVDQIVRVLRHDGVFITQQVGRRNMQNILAAFGWGPQSYGEDWWQEMPVLVEQFQQRGCSVIALAEYDVRYWFCDVESLVFWLQAVPLPEDFDIEKHWRQVERISTAYRTPKGIETNEHRELLIVQKAWRSVWSPDGRRRCNYYEVGG